VQQLAQELNELLLGPDSVVMYVHVQYEIIEEKKIKGTEEIVGFVVTVDFFLASVNRFNRLGIVEG
jgi:hypothetical protein